MCLPKTAQKVLMTLCEGSSKPDLSLYKSIYKNILYTYKTTSGAFYFCSYLLHWVNVDIQLLLLPLFSSQLNRIGAGGRLGNTTLSLEKTSLFFNHNCIFQGEKSPKGLSCSVGWVWGYVPKLQFGKTVFLWRSSHKSYRWGEPTYKGFILHSSNWSECYLQDQVCTF